MRYIEPKTKKRVDHPLPPEKPSGEGILMRLIFALVVGSILLGYCSSL